MFVFEICKKYRIHSKMKNTAIHMIVSKGNQHLFQIYFANRCLQKNDQEITQDILRNEIHIILFEKIL